MAVVVAFISGYVLLKTNEKIVNNDIQKNNIANIKKKLDKFYLPFLALSKKNTLIYKVFSKKYTEEGNNFRTLIELLKGRNFEDNDKVLLEHIIKNGIKLNELILKYSWCVDDIDLLISLVDASSHYTLIEMAYKKELDGESERFQEYVHPNDLAIKIEEKIKVLQTEIIALRGNMK